jgi:hypothetical protein
MYIVTHYQQYTIADVDRTVYSSRCGQNIIQQQMWTEQYTVADVDRTVYSSRCGQNSIQKQTWKEQYTAADVDRTVYSSRCGQNSIQQLEYYGIIGRTGKLIKSYLNNRY